VVSALEVRRTLEVAGRVLDTHLEGQQVRWVESSAHCCHF